MPDTATTVQKDLFALEGNEMVRKEYREISTNTEHMKKVDIAIIEIRPDQFNARVKPDWMNEDMWEQVLGIAALADGIYASNGPADAIVGDFHKDGKFYITAGERRTRAIRHLMRTERTIYPNGQPVSAVTIVINPPGTTDVDRIRKMLNENDTLPLSIMQRAHTYKRLKEKYELTDEQIADMFPGQRVSRQTVNNYIKAATELDQDTQDKIDSGELKLTNVLSELRKQRPGKKKPEGQEDDEPIITGSLAEKLEKDEKNKGKIRGDEDEFEQKDNSLTFAGSKTGPKEDKSSNAIVVGQDSIYHLQQKENLFKQLINRYHVLNDNARKLIVPERPADEEDEIKGAELYEKRQKHVIQQLMNEYNITVK